MSEVPTPSFGALPTLGPQGPQSGEQNTAPAPMAGGPAAVDQNSQRMAVLVQMMMQRMAPQKKLAQPHLASGYGPSQTAPQDYIGGIQGSKMGEIGAGLANIGATIHNAVAEHKQRQIDDAANVWRTLNDSWDEAMALSGGDEKKAMETYSQMRSVQSILNDKKKQKELQKVFGVDLTHPEKQAAAVYTQGLAQENKRRGASKALDAVKKIVTLGMARQQQRTQQGPPPTPEQRQQATKEAASKLPFTHSQPKVSDEEALAKFLQAQQVHEDAVATQKIQIQNLELQRQRLDEDRNWRLQQIDQQLADTKLDKAERRRLEGARVGIAAENAQSQKLATWGRLAQE